MKKVLFALSLCLAVSPSFSLTMTIDLQDSYLATLPAGVIVSTTPVFDVPPIYLIGMPPVTGELTLISSPGWQQLPLVPIPVNPFPIVSVIGSGSINVTQPGIFDMPKLIIDNQLGEVCIFDITIFSGFNSSPRVSPNCSAQVAEPASLGLLALGTTALLLQRRKRPH